MNLSYYYMKSVLKTWACCAGCAALAVASAKANTTFDISSGNSALSGYSGPFATVEVSLVDSTHATVTFTALVGGGYQFLFGGASAVDVNVNASSFTQSGLSWSQLSGFSAASVSDGGAGNVSSFGNFNQTFSAFDGYTHATTTTTFTLTDTSGIWASSADVLTPNAAGHPVAAHIFIANFPATTNSDAIVTGFATDGGTTSVPDATATSLLLGAAVSVLGLARRKLS
jgi:hypothetical protein